MVRSIGADRVVDYTRDDFARSRQRYDLVLDAVGNRSLSDLRRAMKPTGTLVVVGGDGGRRWFGPVAQLLKTPVLSRFVSQRLVQMLAKPNKADLGALNELIEAGKLTPVVERKYSLSDAPDAIRHLETRHARGKTIIVVQSSA
jgi:NADPH:quinone reductase-like Zn-dependent oxidoreductase